MTDCEQHCSCLNAGRTCCICGQQPKPTLAKISVLRDKLDKQDEQWVAPDIWEILDSLKELAAITEMLARRQL